jgi:hypothetical protein
MAGTDKTNMVMVKARFMKAMFDSSMISIASFAAAQILGAVRRASIFGKMRPPRPTYPWRNASNAWS